ncbi:reverse transcriptase domain-containing protein [Tanacetum coccineum]
MSRTINRKPNKDPTLRKKSHPSSPPEQMFASATQQMVGNQKRSSGGQNLIANREGRHKCIDGIEPEQRKHVRLGSHCRNDWRKHKQEKAPRAIGTVVEQQDIVSFYARVSTSRFSYNTISIDRRIPAETKAKLKESRTTLVGFSGEPYTSKNKGAEQNFGRMREHEEQEAMETKAPENMRTEADIWKLYTDGASNEHGSGAGLILIDTEGAEYSYALRLNFANSNNDAEYEALLAGLRIATKMKVEKMHAFVDSKLIASQISHIPREENRKVDALSKLAAVQCEGLTKGVLIEELNERRVDTEEVNVIIEEATRT